MQEKTGNMEEESSRMVIGCGGKRQEEEALHFQVEFVTVGKLARLCEVHQNAIT